MTTDWHNGRPILLRLPQVGYQDSPVVDYLTSWVDERLSEKADQLQSLYQDMCDPLTCKSEYLDLLGFLVGLSGSYWDTEWSESVKRQLIANSHTKLWNLKGTMAVLAFVLGVHQIDHQLWTDGDLTLSFDMPGTFGVARLRFYLRMPLKYRREGKEFIEARRTLRNFAPAIVEHAAVYEYLYLGFSSLGDPMFS